MVEKGSTEKIKIGGVALSPKELKVLELNSEGLQSSEIALKTGIPIGTIDKMLSVSDDTRSILPKIEESSRTGAATWYVKHCLAFNENNLHQIQTLHKTAVELRADGKIKQAQTIQQVVISLIDQKLAHHPNHSLSADFDNIKFFALSELARGTQDTTPVGNVFFSTAGYIKEGKNIAKKYNNKELRAIVQLLKGEAHYIDRHFDLALRSFKNAKPITALIEQIRHCRFECVTLAYLGEKSRYNDLKPIAFDLVEQGKEMKLDLVCFLLECLVRTEAMLGNENYIEIVIGQWNAWVQELELSMTSIRRTQMGRSKLEAAVLLGTVDENDAREAEFPKKVAAEGGLTRYVEIINHLQNHV